MRRTNLLALILLLLLCAVSQGSFRFVAWADNRPYDENNEKRFIWMLKQMNSIVSDDEPLPLFHVVPGDYDDRDTTAAVIAGVSDIKTWYRAPGNHDTVDLGMSNDSVDLPGGNPQARFLFLNQYQCPDGVFGCDCSMGRICPHALAWLEIKCQSAPEGFPIFVVAHEPAFPENRHVGDSLDSNETDRDAFWKLLEKYRATYICGHTHYYSTFSSGGATQIDVGNAGAPGGETNQTFVEVVVTDTDVTFTTWQGLINEDYFERESWTVDLATAFNPSPADGATQVAVDTDLSWTAGAGAQSHDVYFGTTDPPPSIQNQNETSYDPGVLDLEYNTTYYWRIDEIEGSTTHQGDVWSFKTFVPELLWIDGFESGSFAAGGWSTSSQATVVSSAADTGNYGALLKKTAWIEKAVSTVGYDSIYVNYARKTKGLDTDEFLYVEWNDGSSSNSNNWIELEKTQDSSWSSVTKTCGIGAGNNAKFKIRFSTNGNAGNDEAMVDEVEITNIPPDNTPPTPDPLTWNSLPSATGPTSISMTATTASDPSGVEYYFVCTDGGGHDSDWQDSETYEDTGLSLGMTCTYRVKARDKSAERLETGLSTEESATTTESGDGTMHVGSIDMDIIPGKKYRATATVEIFHALEGVEGATVVGDWYFKGVLRLSGATGVTDADGKAMLTSLETPAKTGDTFKFIVTDVYKSGWDYDPTGDTIGSIDVP